MASLFRRILGKKQPKPPNQRKKGIFGRMLGRIMFRLRGRRIKALIHAVPTYMEITGEKQGNITRGCNTRESMGIVWHKKQHENQILVQAIESGIVVPEAEYFSHKERISFTYREIIWKHELSNTESSDNWRKW